VSWRALRRFLKIIALDQVTITVKFAPQPTLGRIPAIGLSPEATSGPGYRYHGIIASCLRAGHISLCITPYGFHSFPHAPSHSPLAATQQVHIAAFSRMRGLRG